MNLMGTEGIFLFRHNHSKLQNTGDIFISKPSNDELSQCALRDSIRTFSKTIFSFS